jgi:hypothetical protein
MAGGRWTDIGCTHSYGRWNEGWTVVTCVFVIVAGSYNRNNPCCGSLIYGRFESY